MRSGDEVLSRQRNRGFAGHAAGLASFVVPLAFIAFLLLPTSHANLSSIASVNGHVYSLPSSASITSVASDVISLAKPGSSLDITGDVLAIGSGRPMKTHLGGHAVSPDAVLTDGAVVLVAHGENTLEGIAAKTEAIPFKTVVEGSGAIVHLAQLGNAGERTLYLGMSSRKQAAVFTLSAPHNEILQRTPTAKDGQKLVALTFDDGPGKWTQSVLDALAAKHVPATFFVLGSSAAGNTAMIRKLRDAGHEVENHTWGHPQLDKLTPDQIRSQIARTEAVIGPSRFLRPPYGAYNATVAGVATSMGYRLALWTVDTLDWKNRDADAIFAHVKSETKPGAIILMHDGGLERSQTVAAIPKIVDWLLRNGYSLTTVRNLL